MKVDSQKDKKQLKRLSIDMPLRRIQKLCRDQHKLWTLHSKVNMKHDKHLLQSSYTKADATATSTSPTKACIVLVLRVSGLRRCPTQYTL